MKGFVDGAVTLTGGLALIVAALSFAWVGLVKLRETVGARWRLYWRASATYGPVAGARYRLGVRLLLPYLERRYIDAQTAEKLIPRSDHVVGTPYTIDDLELLGRRRQAVGRTIELLHLVRLDRPSDDI